MHSRCAVPPDWRIVVLLLGLDGISAAALRRARIDGLAVVGLVAAARLA